MRKNNTPTRPRLDRLPFHPSAFLLAVQLLLLIVYAVFDWPYTERWVVNLIGVVVLMLVVWVVNRSPGLDWIAWALAVPAFVLSLLSEVSANPSLFLWASLLEAALYFYAAGSLIAYMMEDYRVTTDELFAAGATFTLLAWGFAFLFSVVETGSPGSFVPTLTPGRSPNFIELLFLSFTNLTSTGLSDIVTATTWARVLVMFEQISGIGYIAVVVSRLVGLTIQRQERSRP